MFKFKVNRPIIFTDDDKVAHSWKPGDLIELGELYRIHWYLVDLQASGGITIIEDIPPELTEPEKEQFEVIGTVKPGRGRPRANR